MLSQPDLNTSRQTPPGMRVKPAADHSLAEELSVASTWKARARLARRVRSTYALAAMPILVEKLQQGNMRKRQIHETAGALFFSALLSGVVVLMHLLLVLVCIGLAGLLGVVLLRDGLGSLQEIIGPNLTALSQAMAGYVPVLAALAGIVYLGRGWAKLGGHLIVREMHCGVGLLKLGGLLVFVTMLLLAVPLGRFKDPLWEAIVTGYLLTLFGCFLQGMLADYDGYMIEAELGEHPDNLYRLAFAIHAHAAVDNITQLFRSEAARQLCKNCLVQMELVSDQVINTQYFRCRSCYRIYDGVQVLADRIRLVAVIDAEWEELESQEGDILFINALRRPAGFNFDEVLIQQADDAQIERFIMKVENDLDELRRPMHHQVVCHVPTSLPLSAHTRNLLRNTFGAIQDA